MHTRENIKSVYLEDVKKILHDLLNRIPEEICLMSFAKLKTKLKDIFSKTHLWKLKLVHNAIDRSWDL